MFVKPLCNLGFILQAPDGLTVGLLSKKDDDDGGGGGDDYIGAWGSTVVKALCY